VLQVFLGVYFAVGPVVAKEYLGGAGAWAAILTVGGIGSVIGGPLVMHLGSRRPLVTALLAAVPFFAMPIFVALTPPVVVLCLLSAVASIGALLTQTLFGTIVQRAVPAEVLGRVFAIDLTLSQIGLPVGLFLGGALVPVLGARTVLGAAGICGTTLCVLVAALGPIRRMRLPAIDASVSTS
jgi:MFS family permease